VRHGWVCVDVGTDRSTKLDTGARERSSSGFHLETPLLLSFIKVRVPVIFLSNKLIKTEVNFVADYIKIDNN